MEGEGAQFDQMALCLIIFFLMFLVGVFTVGLGSILCPFGSSNLAYPVNQASIRGFAYLPSELATVLNLPSNASAIALNDLSHAFASSRCAAFAWFNTSDSCSLGPGAENGCFSMNSIQKLKSTRISVEWSQISAGDPKLMLIVYNSAVINLAPFLQALDAGKGINISPATKQTLQDRIGTDATRVLSRAQSDIDFTNCLADRYTIGYIGTQSLGCTVYNTFQTLALVIVVGLILTRFLMALLFHWIVAPKIAKPLTTKLRASMPMGPNSFVASRMDRTSFAASVMERSAYLNLAQSVPLPTDLYTICLVTCYSEGITAIKNTLDSLTATDYPDERKLLFFICDGLVLGQGNSKSTPDFIVDLIDRDLSLGVPEYRSYLAIADGEKQHNMAQVFAGHYSFRDHRVPVIIVVKCGTETERSAYTPSELAAKKAGNRGKRDSQVILMNFLSRVAFNDRMTPLDYDLFHKIQHITGGVTPDQYELLLMVDADTSVNSDSLGYMVNAMVNDDSVMGLCGETRISNKKDSWVTRIQVYEYFTSHNLGKAFESMFGGVTCLPGCFCMVQWLTSIESKQKKIWG